MGEEKVVIPVDQQVLSPSTPSPGSLPSELHRIYLAHSYVKWSPHRVHFLYFLSQINACQAMFHKTWFFSMLATTTTKKKGKDGISVRMVWGKRGANSVTLLQNCQGCSMFQCFLRSSERSEAAFLCLPVDPAFMRCAGL